MEPGARPGAREHLPRHPPVGAFRDPAEPASAMSGALDAGPKGSYAGPSAEETMAKINGLFYNQKTKALWLAVQGARGQYFLPFDADLAKAFKPKELAAIKTALTAIVDKHAAPKDKPNPAEMAKLEGLFFHGKTKALYVQGKNGHYLVEHVVKAIKDKELDSFKAAFPVLVDKHPPEPKVKPSPGDMVMVFAK
jgi:hypothetical protein